MNIVFKGISYVSYLCTTIFVKIKWRDSLDINGLFRKRKDTQIIISENGRMQIGQHVTFQKNVALSSCGGGCTLAKKYHLTEIVLLFAEIRFI